MTETLKAVQPQRIEQTDTLLTNEWTDAKLKKPWCNRLVIVRLEDGSLNVAKWNGAYWEGRNDMRLVCADEITHFYIFEKFNKERDVGEKMRDRVLYAIQEVTGVTFGELKGKSRIRKIVFCRFIAAKELYSRTKMTMVDIAELMERDLKSIPYYLTRYQEDYKSFANFRQMADRIGDLIDGEV